MKTAMLFVVSLTCASLPLAATAGEQPLSSHITKALVEVCTNTADDDRLALHNTLKNYRLSKQNAVEKVVCNGEQLMTFARNNQAIKVSAMLQPYEDRIKGRVIIKDVAAPSAN